MTNWYYKTFRGIFVLTFAVFSSLACPLFSQDKGLNDVNYKKFYFPVTTKDSVITLPDKFLVDGSVTVYADSIEISPANYSIDLRYGKLKFTAVFYSLVFEDSLKKYAGIIVSYKNYPFDFPDVYSKFEVLSKLDTLREDTVKVAEVKEDIIEDIFAGTNLEKSGSIFRGFTVGNNRDLTLNSGFRLQMTGKLTSDIEIVAALTDESTPIQPEGNTQKLQELDKVFVELKTKNITTTLGDIDVNFSNLDFFNFSRKVQGAKGFGYLDKSNLFISAAISRGRFNTNTFNGIDGVQGPYRLVGANNEVNIVVIAGTEKVYVDGILMTRGETNDYTIDYSNGQITFTNRRLIINASRITADFEYSDKKYSRSLIAGQTQTSLFNDRLKLAFSYIREKDDKDKPIDFTLSDSDRVVISNAGDDRLKASKSGVSFVGRDSLGKPLGLYKQIDTTINNTHLIFYRYLPGNDSAFYQVTFSFVGAGKGDYTSLSTTSYRFVGIGLGSYLPIIFFPLPVSYQSGDMSVDLKLSKSFSFHVEGALSDFDKNLFSSNDDKNNKGLAVNSYLAFDSENLKIGKTNFGNLGFIIRQKFINKLYSSLDRLNRVEYNRVWDIQDSTNQTEITTELETKYIPNKYLLVNATGGTSKRGEGFNSYRGLLDVRFGGDSLMLPYASYTGDYISSKDTSIDYKGLWIRHSGLLDYKISPWKKKFGVYNFIFNIYGEDKQIRSLRTDTANIGSFRYYEFKPKFAVTGFFHVDFSYQFIYRFDDVYQSGSITRQANSLTHTYSFRLKDLDFVASNIDFTMYDKKYTQTFLSKGFIDSRTILVTSQTYLWLLNRGLQTSLFYKVSSERTAKSQVVFLKVAVGQGNYKYIGDVNGNGVQDENEFILVNYDGDYIKLIIPTDQTFPTTDLQSSAVINIAPDKLAEFKKGSFLNRVFSNISFDSYLTVNEKSKDPKQSNIYLLKFGKFLNEQNTISGSNSIQQDINMFEKNEYFGVRLRYIQKKGFSQYYSGNERLLNVERSARLRLSFTPDITWQTDYVSETNRNLAPTLSFRNWNISSKSVISEVIYVPVRNIETGFIVELKRAYDYYPALPTKADVNKQTLKFNYSLEGKGKLRVEVNRYEAILSINPLFLPYELTKGINVGKSYLWSVGFEYRITNFIQATVNYFGRAEGRSKVIHTGTAELRAYF